MISGLGSNELAFNILKTADLAQLTSLTAKDRLRLSYSLNVLFLQNPQQIDALVNEGLSRNALYATLIVSMLMPNYFEHNIAKFKIDDFRTTINDGILKGKSALWLLAETASNGSPEAFMVVLNQYKDQLAAADFTTSAQHGIDEGISVLWALADAAHNGEPEALIAVLNQYNDQFTTADFTASPQNGPLKSISVLWWLAYAAAEGKPEGLLAVLNQFKDQFTAADFTACAQDQQHKGISVLWMLAHAAAKGKAEAFMMVFNQYKDLFNAADFTASPQDGPLKGISVLWWLADAVSNDKTEAFIAVLNQYKDQLTADDFTARTEDKTKNGISILWLLADAADNGNPEALMRLLNQFKDQFTAADFNASPQDGSLKFQSALSMLANTAANGTAKPLMGVLAHIAFDVLSLTDLNKETLPNEAQNLVIARLNLAALLENTSTDEKQLFSAAEAAKLAGYSEAYYDLGSYFEKMNKMDLAARAFLELPTNSYYFDTICNEYSTRFIGIATEAFNSHAKHLHLDTALKFTLKIENDENRHTTLQLIARIYVNHLLGNGADVGSALISQHLLEVMHGDLDSSWCFKEFERLAEYEKLKLLLKQKEQTIVNLSEKLKKTKRERELEQHNFREMLTPIKELLSHFQDQKQGPAENTQNESETNESRISYPKRPKK